MASTVPVIVVCIILCFACASASCGNQRWYRVDEDDTTCLIDDAEVDERYPAADDRIDPLKLKRQIYLWHSDIAKTRRYNTTNRQIQCRGEHCNETRLACEAACSAVYQCKCVDGQQFCDFRSCGLSYVCGFSGLQDPYELKSKEVHCEPYWDDNDPYILKDSCYVIYELEVDYDNIKPLKEFPIEFFFILILAAGGFGLISLVSTVAKDYCLGKGPFKKTN